MILNPNLTVTIIVNDEEYTFTIQDWKEDWIGIMDQIFAIGTGLV